VDLDVLALVLDASLIVKLTLLLLLVLSVLSWGIIGTKWIELRNAARDGEAFLDVFHKEGLDKSFEAARQLDRSPLAAIFIACVTDMKRMAQKAGRTQLGSYEGPELRQLQRRVLWTAARESSRLERGLAVLSTTGSSAPFIGLFGTVVGIIQSFQGIARAGSASLAVVAPGIAEALVATAVGLLAAIPATIFYNIHLARLEDLRSDVELFTDELERDLGAFGKARSGGAPGQGG